MTLRSIVLSACTALLLVAAPAGAGHREEAAPPKGKGMNAAKRAEEQQRESEKKADEAFEAAKEAADEHREDAEKHVREHGKDVKKGAPAAREEAEERARDARALGADRTPDGKGRGDDMRARRDERKVIMEETKSGADGNRPPKGQKPWWRFWQSDEPIAADD